MNPHVEIALARPVFDPMVEMGTWNQWWPEPKVSAILTCNLGLE